MSVRRDNLTSKCFCIEVAFGHADVGAANQAATVTITSGVWQSPGQAPKFTAIFDINLT